jgi:hypothetical protein
VDVVGADGPGRHELFDFGDSHPPGHSADRVEVAG